MPPLILLTEENETLRRVAVETLEREGYRVITAVHRDDCLRTYGGVGPEHFALVILECTWPQPHGAEAFEGILRLNPGARILFTSAAAEECRRRVAGKRAVGVLPKPYTARRMLAAIAAALERAPANGLTDGSPLVEA